MKRIVMFTNTFEPMVGGLERSVANAHEDLLSAGHFCRVVTPSFKGAEHSANGILRVPALMGIGRKEFSVPMRTSVRMEHWMEAIAPQVLHSHQPFLLGDTAWRIARLRRIPLVFTHHTLYERYAHYLLVDVERARRLVIDLTSRYANRCQLVIAPTPSVRDILIDRGVLVPIEVAPSGIDWELYAGGCAARGREMFGLRATDQVAGHLGRLSQEKNIGFLIESMLRLMHTRPNLKLLLVGDGDRLQWTRERFEQERLSDRLIAPGTLAGADVANAYAAMDVFVFASNTDTQGLVLAEAMAAGVPVVALDAPGARDCVIDQVTGQLLPAAIDEAGFALAVGTLLDDPQRSRELSTAARDHSRRYARPLCLQRLLELYERALQGYRPDDVLPIDKWDHVAERFDVEWTPFWEKVTTAVRALASRVDTSTTQ